MVTAIEEPPSKRAAAESSTVELISVLGPNDILLGRGIGPSHYIGNKRFRDVVASRKEEYTSTKSYKRKRVIARQVFDEIKSRGGRFLKLDESDKPVASIVGAGSWKEAKQDEALEKCKQSLREKKEWKGTGGAAKGASGNEVKEESLKPCAAVEESLKPHAAVENERILSSHDSGLLEGIKLSANSSTVIGGSLPLAADLVDELTCSEPAASSFNGFAFARSDTATYAMPPSNVSKIPSGTLLDSVGRSAVDPRLLLFRTAPHAFQQQLIANLNNQTQRRYVLQNPAHQGLLQQYLAINPQVYNPAQHGLLQQYLKDEILCSQLRDVILSQTPPGVARAVHNDINVKDKEVGGEVATGTSNNGYSAMTAEHLPTTEGDSPSNALEDDLMELLLSTFLGYSDETIFTKEQEEMERATLCAEERVAALSDMFGQLCLVGNHQIKKAKRDLDEKTVAFLLKQVRDEIERTPQEKKSALLEAQMKSRAEEFSNGRLEQFLRFEDMNPKVILSSSLHCLLHDNTKTHS